MKISTLAARLHRLPYLARKMKHNLVQTWNDEFFWDEYANSWEKTEEHRHLKYLGNEWTGEEGFLSLLHKHANHAGDALEIGCGGGRITSVAARLFRHVYAADVSSEMLRKCRKSVDASNISFHKLDGFTLKGFPDASVDCIYSHDVFVHFSTLQVYPYLLEIRRVLKPTGIAIISFLNFMTQFEWFKEESLELWSRRRYPPHLRHYFVTEEILRRMFNDLALEVLEIKKDDNLVVVLHK